MCRRLLHCAGPAPAREIQFSDRALSCSHAHGGAGTPTGAQMWLLWSAALLLMAGTLAIVELCPAVYDRFIHQLNKWLDVSPSTPQYEATSGLRRKFGFAFSIGPSVNELTIIGIATQFLDTASLSTTPPNPDAAPPNVDTAHLGATIRADARKELALTM